MHSNFQSIIFGKVIDNRCRFEFNMKADAGNSVSQSVQINRRCMPRETKFITMKLRLTWNVADSFSHDSELIGTELGLRCSKSRLS